MEGPDIFLSYSRDDREAAARVAFALEHEGYSVWWDAAIHSGETFDEVIERNLRAARVVLVLWSPSSVGSRWVRAEATQGDRRQKLVPAIIEPCELPIAFELTHNTNLSGWSGDRADPAWKQLMADIAHHLGREPQPFTPPTLRRHGERQVEAAAPAPTTNRDEAIEATQFFTSASSGAYDDQELHVLHMAEGEGAPRQHVIGPLGVKIGRSKPADIVLSDPRVSRSHCQIIIRGEALEVTDLSSTNGTYVDDDRIDGPTTLPVGSELRVGHVRLTHEMRKRDELFS
ncbi:TIR domain-containing protein [Sphingomicrobium flavum]|uniref:TIR domain-containing protein n=1 Tax=Sphingomicrobium flavum TaxID=1229164 RepID=UPI0021AD5CC8|nr:TIR domain-containing protein [Sphingomicrobium flavum]